nr:EOG090X0DEG [Sida crystallina]
MSAKSSNRRSFQSTGFIWILSLFCTAAAFSHQDAVLTEAYLRGFMNRFGDKMAAAPDAYGDYGLPNYEDMIAPSNDESEKEFEDSDAMDQLQRAGLSLRDQEFLQHSSLFSNNQHMGEGKTVMKPTAKPPLNGDKPENVLPAYCNPPNPCPIGYTGEDGCLEEFENTATFSREYQASQDCMCDTEHMFDCPVSSAKNSKGKNRANAAAANMVDTAIRKIMSEIQNDNPFLQGDKLPIAAKKGNQIPM